MHVDERARLLSEIADGTVSLDDEAGRGLRTDLRFQAELVRYRKLLGALHSLRSEVVDPGRDFVDEVLVALDEGGRHPMLAAPSARKAAYIGGLAAATAAGVGGAILLARRHRRLAA